MKYALNIRKHNQQAHIDIESDIQTKRTGLYTCVLRVNNGNIVDYNAIEYVDVAQYAGLNKIT